MMNNVSTIILPYFILYILHVHMIPPNLRTWSATCTASLKLKSLPQRNSAGRTAQHSAGHEQRK